jgi:hypothetical protein
MNEGQDLNFMCSTFHSLALTLDRLPPADALDVVELLKARLEAQDEEEFVAIYEAVREIFQQRPVTARSLNLPRDIG